MIEAALILALPGIIMAFGVVFQMIRNNDIPLTRTMGASLAMRWFSALVPKSRPGSTSLPRPWDHDEDPPDGS
jgi:ABC-type molybdate transport system permease subunit